MPHKEILLLVFVLVHVSINMFIAYEVNRIIKGHEKVIGKYAFKNKELTSTNDELMIFCISHVLKNSLDKEDYETAARCRNILIRLSLEKAKETDQRKKE